MSKKFRSLPFLLIILALLLAACAPQAATPAPAGQPQVTTVVETVEVMVAGTPMVVTATPPPPPPAKEFNSANPDTLVDVVFGEPETFDPALDYESAGGEVISNIYDTLIFYDREKAGEFVPQLAVEVPSQANGGISEDGLTYTFQIRDGVQFHNGADLTPSDVAFTFQRGMLQGGTASPQFLITEPLLGIGIDDVSLLVDPAGGLYDDSEALQAVDPAVLQAACEQVKETVVADEAAGTVTLNLAQPWGAFHGDPGELLGLDHGSELGRAITVAGMATAIPGRTSTPSPPRTTRFTTIANGTGPYMLVHWAQGQEIVLAANDGYWRPIPLGTAARPALPPSSPS